MANKIAWTVADRQPDRRAFNERECERDGVFDCKRAETVNALTHLLVLRSPSPASRFVSLEYPEEVVVAAEDVPWPCR